MNKVKCHPFNWDGLLERIRQGNVIPVIGPQLYRSKNKVGKKKGMLLYDILARELLKECGTKPPAHEHLSFAKAALAFLKEDNNTPVKLSETLKKKMKEIHFIPGNPLMKLTRIKPFNLYITTVYDDFLANTLHTVRHIPVKTFVYALNKKEAGHLDDDLIASLDNQHCALVYHLFGRNEGQSLPPAYAKNDTLKNLQEFIKDMNEYRQKQNKLFEKLRGSDLLFMGFHSEYDSLFFSTLIPALQNKLPHPSPDFSSSVFIGGISPNDNKNSLTELVDFLESYNTGFIYTCESEDFVDCLFRKLREYDDQLIIPGADVEDDGIPACLKEKSSEEKIPVAFISYRKGDQDKAAKQLTENLKHDGINVWIDSIIEGGDDFDKEIRKAINKCPVFIPLISKDSQYFSGEYDEKYYYKEWNIAIKNIGKNKSQWKIIPVIIDKTEWKYAKFKKYHHLTIPGGNKDGDYKKLKKQLKAIQGKPITKK